MPVELVVRVTGAGNQVPSFQTLVQGSDALAVSSASDQSRRPVEVTSAIAAAVPDRLLTLRLTRERPAPAPKPLPWPLVLGTALLAGPVAGIVLGLLAAFSGGPLGDGRMATIGPDPWAVGLVATAVLGVSTAIGAAAARMVRPLPKG